MVASCRLRRGLRQAGGAIEKTRRRRDGSGTTSPVRSRFSGIYRVAPASCDLKSAPQLNIARKLRFVNYQLRFLRILTFQNVHRAARNAVGCGLPHHQPVAALRATEAVRQGAPYGHSIYRTELPVAAAIHYPRVILRPDLSRRSLEGEAGRAEGSPPTSGERPRSRRRSGLRGSFDSRLRRSLRMTKERGRLAQDDRVKWLSIMSQRCRPSQCCIASQARMRHCSTEPRNGAGLLDPATIGGDSTMRECEGWHPPAPARFPRGRAPPFPTFDRRARNLSCRLAYH
jgi:hypothetical protein